MSKTSSLIDWCICLVKGILIGTGFILPGVSGGALAAIFGLYERMIEFMAHVRRDFKNNLIYFIPVLVGMFVGIVLLSYPLDYFLTHYLGPSMWFFIGAIVGTMPSLWKQAGKKGREKKHLIITLLSAAGAYLGLQLLSSTVQTSLPLTPLTWMIAGGIIALGVLVPGLSASNLLLYVGMYTAMVEGFKALDFGLIAPLVAGGLITMIAFAKGVDWLFDHAYAGLFHFIFGLLVASTLMILPQGYDYTKPEALWCIPAALVGIALGLYMAKLEETYK